MSTELNQPTHTAMSEVPLEQDEKKATYQDTDAQVDVQPAKLGVTDREEQAYLEA